MKQSDLKITSKVVTINGTPRLFINNEMIEGDSYVTYYTNNNSYKEFSDIGFNLFSISVYFSTRTINEISQIPPFANGLFDSKDGLSVLDKEVEKILAINKNALIFLRVDTSLPKSWDNKHKKELNDEGINGGSKRPCLSSEIYKKDVEKYLKKLVTHIVNSSYGEHIFGYQISGGLTQEWMAFDLNGNHGLRSEQKFIQKKKKDPIFHIEEYEKFKNEETAHFICDLAKYLKRITDHRLVVGSFYGYTVAVVYRRFGHLALDIVLNCKDIDFLCSPIGYYTNRSPFEYNPLMTPLASLKLHDKLYFTENDTRTDLSKPANNLPHYNTPIWFGPNRELSLEMCKMHFASSICKGHTYWWFDMWGKWYDHQDFYSLFKKLKSISHEALKKDLTSVSDIAIIYSSNSMYHVSDDAILNKVNRDIFPILGKSGLIYDVYSIKDYKKIIKDYKLFIILCPFMSNDIKTMIKLFKDKKINFAVYNKDSSLTSDDFRRLAKDNGVNVIFDKDIIRFENKSYLYLHATEDITIRSLPNYKLKSLIDDVSFPLFVEKGKGYLFEKL